jgi:hypothetical protein
MADPVFRDRRKLLHAAALMHIVRLLGVGPRSEQIVRDAV